MLLCHCNTHCCNGTERSRRTIEAHRVDDGRERARRAVAAYDAAIEEDEVEIVSYISSLTLSQSSHEIPEDGLLLSPLCGQALHPSNLPVTSNIPPRPSRRPLHDALTQLDSINVDLTMLESATLSTLQGQIVPTSAKDEFPLLSACNCVRELRNRLNRINLDDGSIRQRKEEIRLRLKLLGRSLTAASSSWDLHIIQFREKLSPAPIYNTGTVETLSCGLVYLNLFRAPLPTFPRRG